MILNFFDFLISSIFNLITFLFGLLPGDPAADLLGSLDVSPLETGLGWLNYIVPVSTLVPILGTWAAAMLFYNAFLAIKGFARR